MTRYKGSVNGRATDHIPRHNSIYLSRVHSTTLKSCFAGPFQHVHRAVAGQGSKKGPKGRPLGCHDINPSCESSSYRHFICDMSGYAIQKDKVTLQEISQHLLFRLLVHTRLVQWVTGYNTSRDTKVKKVNSQMRW